MYTPRNRIEFTAYLQDAYDRSVQHGGNKAILIHLNQVKKMDDAQFEAHDRRLQENMASAAVQMAAGRMAAELMEKQERAVGRGPSGAAAGGREHPDGVGVRQHGQAGSLGPRLRQSRRVRDQLGRRLRREDARVGAEAVDAEVRDGQQEGQYQHAEYPPLHAMDAAQMILEDGSHRATPGVGAAGTGEQPGRTRSTSSGSSMRRPQVVQTSAVSPAARRE